MNAVTVRKLTPTEWETALAGAPVPDKPTSVVAKAREELAQRLGLQQGKIRTYDPRWGALFKAGAKVDLHLSRERFEVMLRREDIGIHSADPDDRAGLAAETAMNSLIELGSRSYLPETWPESPEDKRHGPTRDSDLVDDAARYFLTRESHRTHMGWFVAEGRAECGHCGVLEPADARLSEHLADHHPDEYAEFERLAKQIPYVGAAVTGGWWGWRGEVTASTVEDALTDLVDQDEASYSAFMDRYPVAVGNVQGKPGRERGWHWRYVMAELEKFRAAYEAVGQRVVDNYDVLLGKSREQYAIIGFGNYERLRAHAVSLGPKALEAFENSYGSEITDYVHGFVDRMMSGVPKVEQVARSYRFDIEVGHVPLASELELDRLRAARFHTATANAQIEERVAWAKVNERVRVETAQDRLTAETLEAEARVVTAQTQARASQAVRIETELAQERKARASEMERRIAAQAQRRLEEDVFRFLDTARANVRGLVYDVYCDALAAIQANDKLPAGSVKGLRNLVETIEKLDFTNEPNLRAQLDQVSGLLDGKAQDRDERLIGERLREIAMESRLILMDLNYPPKRSAAGLGIPDSADDLIAQLARPRPEVMLDLTEPLAFEPEARSRPEAALAL